MSHTLKKVFKGLKQLASSIDPELPLLDPEIIDIAFLPSRGESYPQLLVEKTLLFRSDKSFTYFLFWIPMIVLIRIVVALVKGSLV